MDHEQDQMPQEHTETAESIEPIEKTEEVNEAKPEERKAPDYSVPQGNAYQYQYQQNGYQNPYANTGYHPDYSQNYNEDGMDTRPLSMGEWALTILALLLPCCIGEVLYIVWAFSKKGNVNRRNFCRAALIIMAVVLMIYLVVIILFGSVIYSTVASELSILF